MVAVAAPPWVGVWRGTVGAAPVQVCLQHREYGENGSYYYLKHRVPIALVSPDRAVLALPILHEGDGPNLPVWRVIALNNATLTATWSDGTKAVPIALTRVAPVDRDADPCGDLSYLRPRLTKPAIVKTRAKLGAIGYTVVTADVGKQFETVEIASFQIDGTSAAIGRINAALLKPIPHKAEGSDYLDCMTANLVQQGRDGDYEEQVMPDLVTRSWVVSRHDRSWFCGMAHPESSSQWTLWDLRTGQTIDPWRWLNMSAAQRSRTSDPDALPTIGPALRKLLIKGWRTTEAECRDIGRDQIYWNPHFNRTGLVFTPALPHVELACLDDVIVPYGALQPLLNAQGKAGVASLQAELSAR